MTQGNAPAAPQHVDRSGLLKETIDIAMNSAFGSQNPDEQKVSQVLGDLVKTKLLTAEESYALRDKLLDSEAFDRFLTERVTAVLKKRGHLPA